MKANVGGIDKILRIVAGLALIAWAVIPFGPGMERPKKKSMALEMLLLLTRSAIFAISLATSRGRTKKAAKFQNAAQTTAASGVSWSGCRTSAAWDAPASPARWRRTRS